jgi:hypothetical protein
MLNITRLPISHLYHYANQGGIQIDRHLPVICHWHMALLCYNVSNLNERSPNIRMNWEWQMAAVRTAVR